MQEFFKQALIRAGGLLACSLLLAWFCIARSYLHAPLLPHAESALAWRAMGNTDGESGGRSTVRLDGDTTRLGFTMRLSRAIAYSLAAADLQFIDRHGKPAHVDLSRYGSIAFEVRCTPANTLMFSVPTFDPKVSRRGDMLSYRAPVAYFACGPRPRTIELDLTRLETPQWWYDMFKLDLSHKDYVLNQVPKLAFGNTFQSPAEKPAHVDIGALVLQGRDYRYLFALGFILISGWAGFAVWFFRSHARALTDEVKSRLQKDLPFVAYQQLSVEPHRDKEKAAVLAYIGAAYADPAFELDAVVAQTGVNRSKINDILKGELGFTFSAYLNKLRLTEAARLLSTHSSAAIAEIAYSVGYANVSYFNKLFKEEYGCTPKAFRAACEVGEAPCER